MAIATGPASELLDTCFDPASSAWDFFQWVRRLEAAHPEAPRIGESLVPGEDYVRFSQEPYLCFAPSAVQRFVPAEGKRKARLAQAFFGLWGPQGPMPLHLSEQACRRSQGFERNAEGKDVGRDNTLIAFADVFHHRMISFFYRAWRMHQQTADLDCPGDSRFANYIGALAGFGDAKLRTRDRVPEWAKLSFVGRLAAPARNASGLEAIVADFFGIAATVDSFVGEWLPLPEADRCRLGDSSRTGRLGSTAIAGERVWVCGLRFRLRLGPMHLADYRRLLPGGDSYERLQDWLRLYVGDELRWEVLFAIRREEVPAVELGRNGRLGWTTWLGTEPHDRDREDLLLVAA